MSLFFWFYCNLFRMTLRAASVSVSRCSVRLVSCTVSSHWTLQLDFFLNLMSVFFFLWSSALFTESSLHSTDLQHVTDSLIASSLTADIDLHYTHMMKFIIYAGFTAAGWSGRDVSLMISPVDAALNDSEAEAAAASWSLCTQRLVDD